MAPHSSIKMDDFYDDFEDESHDYNGYPLDDDDDDFIDDDDFMDDDDEEFGDFEEDEDDFDDEAELLPIIFSSGHIHHYREFLYEITPDASVRFWRNPEDILCKALHKAYQSESMNSVASRRIFHQEGADVLYRGGHPVSTIGHAVNIGRLQMIWEYDLLHDKAARGLLVAVGLSPLLAATANDDIDTVRMLLSLPGMDVNAVDQMGRSAVHLASDLGMMKLLLQHPCVNVNQLDHQQRSPLIGFLSSGASMLSFDIKPLLARPDILVNLQDQFGRTALMYAVEAGAIHHVAPLLAHPEIDITVKDAVHGQTAFDLVQRGGLSAKEFMKAWEAEIHARYCT